MTELTTFNLTTKELEVAVILFESNGCGADRPSDFEGDEYTWVYADALISKGYSKEQAGGFFSSLEKKGFLVDHRDGDSDNGLSNGSAPFISGDGWRWLDTIWDGLMAKEQNRINEIEQNKLIAEQEAERNTVKNTVRVAVAQYVLEMDIDGEVKKRYFDNSHEAECYARLVAKKHNALLITYGNDRKETQF